jgi:hypothetical protein
MTHSRYRAAALALAVVLAACESANVAAPEFSTASSDGLSSSLAVATSAGPRGAGGNSLFDRLANEIKGFGGLYRNGHCSVSVVLTDLSESDHAIRIVKAALEPNRACPDGIRVHAVQGQFTYVELQRYLAAARALIPARDGSGIRGVLGAHLDLKQNRLVITVASRQVAQAVIEALPRLGIPAEAVVFELGRAGSTQRG